MTTYDSFTPFQFAEKQPFSFYPVRFAVWQGEHMTDSGPATGVITAEVVATGDGDGVEVTSSDPVLAPFLVPVCAFDAAVTLADRMQYITVPEQTNVDNIGFSALKSAFGPTRAAKDFAEDEPYGCDLFFENSVLTRLTFSFSGARRVDLYAVVDDFGLDFMFDSSEHARSQGNVLLSQSPVGSKRIVQVEPNSPGKEGYVVTVYNMDQGRQTSLQDEVRTAPMQMKIIAADSEKIVLRGFGTDEYGSSFAEYGLTLAIYESSIQGCTLHLYATGVDIVYLR